MLEKLNRRSGWLHASKEYSSQQSLDAECSSGVLELTHVTSLFATNEL